LIAGSQQVAELLPVVPAPGSEVNVRAKNALAQLHGAATKAADGLLTATAHVDAAAGGHRKLAPACLRALKHKAGLDPQRPVPADGVWRDRAEDIAHVDGQGAPDLDSPLWSRHPHHCAAAASVPEHGSTGPD